MQLVKRGRDGEGGVIVGKKDIFRALQMGGCSMELAVLNLHKMMMSDDPKVMAEGTKLFWNIVQSPDRSIRVGEVRNTWVNGLHLNDPGAVGVDLGSARKALSGPIIDGSPDV
jgi:hypothetical protein